MHLKSSQVLEVGKVANPASSPYVVCGVYVVCLSTFQGTKLTETKVKSRKNQRMSVAGAEE